MKNKEFNLVINWHFIALAVFFITVITLVVLYVPISGEFDSALLSAMKPYLGYLPSFIPLIISEISRYNFLWPLVTACSVLVSHKYYIPAFLLVFFTQAAYVLKDFMKNLICRQRPCGDAYAGYSFPSGHSVVAMCFWGILIYLAIRHTNGFWRYLLVFLFAVMIILSALSRLYLGVHFPLDVIAGLLIGFVLVNLFIVLDKVFTK